MTRLDHLPPDQSAALALLLRQRKSYADVAALLGISEQAIRDRAYGALDGLAGVPPSDNGRDELTSEQRADIGDYLLGQQPAVNERLATRTLLDSSRSAREWASALALELGPLASAPLPEIPAGPALPAARERPAEAPPPATVEETGVPPQARTGRSLPSSRLGGALLLTAIITGVIVAVVLSSGGGGGGGSGNTTPGAASTPAATSTAGGATSTNPSTSTSAATPSTTGHGPSEEARIALTSPNPGSKTVGVAVILAEGTQHAFYLAAERVPPTNGFFYAVWLYNSPTSFEALGKSPPVTSNGRMQGGALLPTNAAAFSKMIVTRETSTRPPSPGPIILSGAFKLSH